MHRGAIIIALFKTESDFCDMDNRKLTHFPANILPTF